MKIFSDGFIIENLEVGTVVTMLALGNNLVVGGNGMAINLILEGFDVDGVAVAVVGKNYVLIPTEILDGETAYIISVEIANVVYMDVKFVGDNLWGGFSSGEIRRWNQD